MYCAPIRRQVKDCLVINRFRCRTDSFVAIAIAIVFKICMYVFGISSLVQNPYESYAKGRKRQQLESEI
jgi:hypothetical protein